ncbi:MAG TPA: DUF6790 family protein, partial [Thermoanaerobaculia bacterium]|nr:DUF6790 family protein [Thermoanaerobaculia bacterium]
MYAASVLLLLGVFPLASIAIEKLALGSPAPLLALAGKWWAFWAAGLRLFLAGLRQATNPRFTSEKIFGFKTDEPLAAFRELGFANLSMGTLGLASLWAPSWRTPAALVGGLYYLLAGVGHVLRGERNSTENLALWSDLAVAAILL